MSGAGDEVRRFRAPLWLVLAVLVTFGRALSFDFVAWDDDVHILENPHLNPVTWAGFRRLMAQPYDHLYIPASYALLAFETFVSRLLFPAESTPWPALFHAVSLALHALNGLLVYLFFQRVGFSARAACWGAIVFAVHPLQIESVVWVSEQRGLLSATGSLVALLGFVTLDDAQEPRRRGRCWRLIVAGLTLGVLAKPTAVVVPLLVLGLEQSCALPRSHWRRSTVVLSLIILAGFALYTKSLQPDRALEFLPSFAERALVAIDALGWYVTRVVWPFSEPEFNPLRSPSWLVQHAHTLLAPPWTLIGWTLAVAWSLTVWIAPRRGDARLAAGMSWFVMGFLPVLGFVPFAYQRYSTVADRYAYLPLVGIGWLVAVWAERRAGPSAERRRGALVAILMLLSIYYSSQWRDSRTLFETALRRNPNHVVALHGLGVLELRAGRFNESQRLFLRAAAIESYEQFVHRQRIETGRWPIDSSILNNLSVQASKRNDMQQSLDYAIQAVLNEPHEARWLVTLGNALAQGGRPDDARLAYLAALKKNLHLPEAHFNWALLLLDQGYPESADKHLQGAILLAPRMTAAYVARARALIARDRWDDANGVLREALEIDPRDLSAWSTLGGVHMHFGRLDAALESFDRALVLEPQHVDARLNRAAVLIALKRPDEARQALMSVRAHLPAESPHFARLVELERSLEGR